MEAGERLREMNRRRRAVVLVLGLTGVGIALARVLVPARFETAVSEGEHLLQDVPEPVLVGAAVLVLLALWIAAMILLARILYWCWKQIDDYVLRFWDLLLPESPLVRFAVGLTVMMALFVLGPLVVLQALEITSDEDPIEQGDADDPTGDEDNQTADNATADDGTNESASLATDWVGPVTTPQWLPGDAGKSPGDLAAVARPTAAVEI